MEDLWKLYSKHNPCLTPHTAKVVIYTDNLNTVQIFNSLTCLPDYNHILHRAVNIVLSHNLNLRVLHVPGDQNIVADALSHCLFSSALDIVPQLKISPFEPPQWMLGLPKNDPHTHHPTSLAETRALVT